jgi:hypothetical protein
LQESRASWEVRTCPGGLEGLRVMTWVGRWKCMIKTMPLLEEIGL